VKDRKIIQMIKQKANEKDIPNVKDMIKEQLDMNQESIQLPKRSFRFRAVYGSFALVLTASLVFILLLVNQTPNVDLFDDQEFSDQVILSAISTVELVNSELTVNNVDSYNTLLAVEDDYVENQIDEVLKYTEFMETLLNNPGAYQKEMVEKSYLNYRQAMIYEFLDMTDQTHVYELYYKQDLNHKTNVYQIEATLVLDEKAYDMVIDGVIDEDTFTVTHQIDQNRRINTIFNKHQLEHQLTFKQYFNDNLEKEALITYGNKEEATLTFIKGQARGIYQFSMDQMAVNGRMMRINYQIGDVDQGSIELTVDDSELRQYILDVKPDNRPPFVQEKDRPMTPRPGHRPGNGRN